MEDKQTISFSGLRLQFERANVLVFTGRQLKPCINEFKIKCGLQNTPKRKYLCFPENSLSGWERIEKAKQIYEESSQVQTVVFTYDTYIMECLSKLEKANEAFVPFDRVKWYKCFYAGGFHLRYFDLTDNIPEMFRDNSEAMQKLFFGKI